MESPAEREARIARLEAERASRQAGTVWPTPDDAGVGVMPVEIAPGRGDLQYPSGFFPTFPTALAMVGYRAVSFARLFQSQPWIASAVMRQLTWAIRVPLRLYRKTGDPNAPEKVTADEHPLAAALENPWLGGSSIDLTMALLGPVLIHGNSATPILSGADDTIQFDPKDWRYTRPIMPWRDSLVGFQFDVDNAELMQTYSLDDVLHIKWWSPIGPIGTSPLQQLGVTLQIEDAAQRVQRATFMHGANPGAALVASEAFLGIKPDERRAILAQLRQDVSALYAGPENAGRPLLLPPGLDWKPAGQTTVEAALVEQRLVAREEVCGVYQIQPPMLGILDKSNKANFDTLREMTYCLPGDSMVSTDRGPVEAASIRAGDRVWSFDPDGMKLSVVSQSAQTSVDPLVKIRTGNRTLRCTDNHPVLVARRHKGDSRKRRPVRWTHEWVAAGQIRRGDLIVTADGYAQDGIRSCPTRSNVTVGFMEFCGLLLGDGNVTRRGGVPAAVSIARAGDARYMDHYRRVMEREFVTTIPGGGEFSARATTAVRLNEQVRSTQFTSRLAAEELAELGLEGTARTKRVPEWVFALAPDLRAAFVRGFADADGSVNEKGHLTFYSASAPLLRQIRELCIGLGVPVANLSATRSWVKLPNGKRIFSVMWRFQACDSQTNAEVIGSNDPQDLHRMKNGSARGTRDYRYRGEGNAPPVVPGCGLARVLEVEHGELAVPVYNISVPGSRNFVADGVVTHNTDTLGPPLVLVEKSLTAQICRDLLMEDDLFLEFDFRAVLRGDPLKEIDHVRSAIGAALMSPNEGRGVLRLGKSDNPAMDDFYLPTNNLQPIGTPARSMVTPVVPFTPDQPPDPSGTPDPAGRRLHVRSRDRDYDKLLAYQYDS